MRSRQEFDKCGISPGGREVKYGLSVAITGVERSAGLEQQLHRGCMTGEDGILERSGSACATGVRIGSIHKKDARDIAVAHPRSVQQRCAAERIPGVYVRSLRDQLLDFIDFSEPHGGVQSIGTRLGLLCGRSGCLGEEFR
jgi:hypothetical protein